MISEHDLKVSQEIFKRIEQTTTQEIVVDFLKSKKLHHTAKNWADLYVKRIVEPLKDGTLTLKDLKKLLEDSEEYGRQHIFLYQCERSQLEQVIASRRIEAIAEELGLTELFHTPKDIDLPDKPTIVEIRNEYDSHKKLKSITIKVVETRKIEVLVKEVQRERTGRTIKIYEWDVKRVVNIAKLDSNGLLEFRIAARDNSTQYYKNVEQLWSLVGKFFPKGIFTSISLSKAKRVITTEHARLKGEIRYRNSTAKSDLGSVLKVSTSMESDNLSDDDRFIAAMNGFLDNNGQVTGVNIYVKIKETDPEREVHLSLAGVMNEFSIRASCTPGDYEYVCGKILSFN